MLFCASVHAQPTVTFLGRVEDATGAAIPFATLRIESLGLAFSADADGFFKANRVMRGSVQVAVSAVGFQAKTTDVDLAISDAAEVVFVLEEDTQHLAEVVVEGQTTAGERKMEAYAVEVVDTRQLQNREVNVNRITSQMAGVRVRESGGLGSNFSYSLNGMSGRSIRFFVDGIPMDRYGSAYSINNFPITLIDRIEVYKGVVPPQMGSDALGGVVNLVTKGSYRNYLDASYSIGSFNTHRAGISSRWIARQTGLYIDVQGYYNHSDNNYPVWGPGVEVADPNTGRAIRIKTRRFHDTYRSVSGKVDVGVAGKKWADQAKLSFQYADNDRELQHGATMAAVIGEATRAETSYAPSVYYAKRDLFVKGLEVSVFSSISWLKTHTVDTSSRIYNWLGEVVDQRPNNSEMGAGSNGKSLLTLNYRNQFHQAIATYNLTDNQKLTLSYALDITRRDGNDPLISNRTASFREPQNLTKKIASLSYEIRLLEERLVTTTWLKHYDYKVSTVDERYITDSLGYRPQAFPIESKSSDIGGGAALKYNFSQRLMGKLSAERSYRLPDATEILGDGLFTRTSPALSPEESLNVNAGVLLSRIPLGMNGRLTIEPSVFYRNTYNLILFQVQETLGMGRFRNIGRVRGVGGSLDVRYEHSEIIKAFGNVTYQDQRDWNEFDGANKSITYKDQLPNTPYFMANGGVSVNKRDVVMPQTLLSLFWDVQYVHQFYLRWPSLGTASTKAVIPTQFVNNTGLSYSLKDGRYNISFSCNNIFNEQVYDNYLLQKPGRSYAVKLRVLIQ